MNQVNTRSNSHTSIEALLVPECPDCGGTDAHLENQHQSFRYGHGAGSAEINCTVPVYRCATCGYQWTGAAAEDARNYAIEQLGLEVDSIQTPNESLDQAEYAAFKARGGRG